MAPRKAMTGRAAHDDREPSRRQPWHAHAERMAARLAADEHIRDPRWREAFAHTPRHLLLPGIDAVGITSTQVPPWWLDAVYTDDSGDTWDGTDVRSVVAPSQPTPAVLAWLLDHLVSGNRDTTSAGRPVRVLEVGAGRGYVTALLCHRLGAENVTATDPHSADHTRGLLASLNLFPCLVSAQGVRGASAYGPFDAILCATARTATLSAGWLSQLASGGRIVAAVRGPDGRVAANIYERNTSGVVRSRTVTREVPATSTSAGTGAS